ncbi:MAG: recombinase family protein [archaeon]
MPCKKCNYAEKIQTKIFGSSLCKVCKTFAPSNPVDFQKYINEKIDWKILDTFRIHGHTPGLKQKKGMQKMASIGRLQGRPPLGYDVQNGNLIPNEDAVRVHSLFKTFLARNYSLNSLSKNFSLSVNGLKKVLTNRTYLGEIKFDNKIHKGDHQPIINPEIFYATQRKLKDYLNPRN